jgi:ElaB/YqjD/DUF883 family membrane-anchored ribosome-binding protein
MARSSDEIREEIAQTRNRIDQDIDALQEKIKRTTDPRSYTERHLLPLIGGALGLGLLIAAIFVRRREEEMPPLPPKKSRRRKVANVVQNAHDEGLIDEEARRVLISLLTAQGLKWLREYIEEESRKATADARQQGAEARLRAEASLHRAADRVSEEAQRAEARASELGHNVTDSAQSLKAKLAGALQRGGDSLDSTQEQLADGAQAAQAHLAAAAAAAAAGLEELRDEATAQAQEIKRKAVEGKDSALQKSEPLFDSADIRREETEARLRAEAEQVIAHAEEAKSGASSLWGRLFGKN